MIIKSIKTRPVDATLPEGTYRGVLCGYIFTCSAPGSDGVVVKSNVTFRVVCTGPALDVELDTGIRGMRNAVLTVLPFGRYEISYFS